MCRTHFTEQHKLALSRIRRDKSIRVSALRNRCLSGPQLADLLNSSTPVSLSTIRRRLRDAGLLGWIARTKVYLRLVNKRNDWNGQKKRNWTEDEEKRYGHSNPSLRSSAQSPWKDAGRALDAICQTWWRQRDGLGVLWCWWFAQSKRHTEQRSLTFYNAMLHHVVIAWLEAVWSYNKTQNVAPKDVKPT